MPWIYCDHDHAGPRHCHLPQRRLQTPSSWSPWDTTTHHSRLSTLHDWKNRNQITLLPFPKPLMISHFTKNKLRTFPHIVKSPHKIWSLLTSLTASMTTIPLTHFLAGTPVLCYSEQAKNQPQGLCTCCTTGQYCPALDPQLAFWDQFTKPISVFPSLNPHFLPLWDAFDENLLYCYYIREVLHGHGWRG